MRITGTERGTIWGLHGKQSKQKYVSTYTQPIQNYVVSWLYHHIWEKISWRFFRYLEKFQHELDIGAETINTPFTNRQDLRCDRLSHKNKIILKTEYEDID